MKFILEEILTQCVQLLFYKSMFYGEVLEDHGKAVIFIKAAFEKGQKLLKDSTYPGLYALMQKIRLYFARLLVESGMLEQSKELLQDNIQDTLLILNLRQQRYGENFVAEAKMVKAVDLV